MWEELHLPPGSAAAPAHTRWKTNRADQTARQTEARSQAGHLTVDLLMNFLFFFWLLTVFEDVTVTSTYFLIFFLPFLVTTAEIISVSENMYYRVGVDCQE